MNPQPKPQRRAPKAKKPLRRSKPMARSRMRRKPARRLKREGANPGYVAWLHSLQSVFPGGTGPIEQSHERNMTGIGRKEPALRSIPMAKSLHEEWEQHRGRYAGWTKEMRRDWMAKLIAIYNAMWFALSDAERARWAERAQTQGESR